MKKILFLALVFLLAIAYAKAEYYDISSHTIDIRIDEDGFAAISEKFFVEFPTEFQLREFRQKNEEIGISLEKWKEFDSRIHIYIGREDELNRAEVGFVENSGKYLEIKYSLNKPIAEKKGETSRLIEFSVLNRFFDQFLQGGVIIIPENATITIRLPSFAEIQKPVKPDAITSANQVAWQGYKSSNVLELDYRLVKQIASLNLADIINATINSPLSIFLAIIVIAIAIVAAIKRKSISEKIENYIVEHSELGSKELKPEESEEL